MSARQQRPPLPKSGWLPKWDDEVGAYRRHHCDPANKRQLRVECVEHEPGVFRVESESIVVPEGRDWQEYAHTVDLIYDVEFDANGEPIVKASCTCESMCRGHNRDTCKHIQLCWRSVANSALGVFVRKMVNIALRERMK